MKKLLFFIFFTPSVLQAQVIIVNDTMQVKGQTDSVFVTANRAERKLSNVTVPVSIVNAKQIQQTGSLRLTDILKEQPGLNLTSGFGAGVQMQGLNPDYTIILINGEPLVGRTAGVLDLNRVALGNIKKIEIVKGPSSSLYGSEAMAGVVNIITDATSAIPLATSIRYGSYQTVDAGIQNAYSTKSVFYQGFYNYYSTSGYSIRPNSNSRVTTPIGRFTLNQQFKYNISERSNIALAIRITDEKITNDISVSNGGATINSVGKENNKDQNINLVFNHRFSNYLKTSVKSYFTEYDAKQDLITISGAPYYDILNHSFKRIENQTDWNISKQLNLIFGMGSVWEGVKSSRYDSEKVRKSNTIQYGFTQIEWTPSNKFILIGGMRFDKNEAFASAFSPKFSGLYKINAKHKLKLSIGEGFKAPDFRQIYLDFTNAAAGGYSVFGTAQAQQVIGKLSTLGQIGTLYDSYYQLKTLKPENSTGINISWQFEPNSKTFLSAQLFRNDIRNLIQVQQVGAYITGAQIFSYLNIGRAFTQGVELEGLYKFNTQFNVSAAYQYLETGDKDQIAQIKLGKVYTRDANGYSKLLSLSEYVGLPNNNKNKIQLKFNYNTDNGFFANFRMLYRSNWAVNNTNGNEVFDKGDEFASGYISLHTSFGKGYKNGLSVQAGCDNITNYIDAQNLPNLPGRTFFATLKYQIIKKQNKI
jgi:outer membrane receptor for ferrienterochelin and colicins